MSAEGTRRQDCFESLIADILKTTQNNIGWSDDDDITAEDAEFLSELFGSIAAGFASLAEDLGGERGN